MTNRCAAVAWADEGVPLCEYGKSYSGPWCLHSVPQWHIPGSGQPDYPMGSAYEAK